MSKGLLRCASKSFTHTSEFALDLRPINCTSFLNLCSKNSSVDEIIAEVFAAEKIKAYGQNIWKLTVPWIVLDEDHNQMIPLNIYTPEVDCSGKKQVFAPGDVIYSETFLMGRVLSKEEWELCSLNYYGIKDD